MKIGFIGLGKMGGQMVQRLIKDGHEIVCMDLEPSLVSKAVEHGAVAVASEEDMIKQLSPVIIWLMIPASVVDAEVDKLLTLLPNDSILIDGGNSDYRLTRERAAKCEAKKVSLIDVGTSGGILGLEKGFSMMLGGETKAVNTITPLITSLAQPNGWAHFGPSGAGHYIKMVHNAIEYGMMQAYAEGYRLLKEGEYADLNLEAIADVWQHGSIISSNLNEITKQALQNYPGMEDIDGFVAESGEARWALETANSHKIEMPVIQASFDVRLASQAGTTNYATKLLAAMRNIFGGHMINKL